MNKNTFDNLILIGRAAAGKSEFIDFLKNLKEEDRSKQFHIGAFDEMDDFPWLYDLFCDEDLWEQLGRKRIYSKKIGCVYETIDYNIYDFTSLKFNIEIQKLLKKNPSFYDKKTLFIEFARGRNDGYKRAFNLLDKTVLSGSAIFFLDNTFEESMRRNTVRSHDNDSNQTVLHHKTPLGVMENYYKTHDWQELTDSKPEGYINIKGLHIPFVTVWNMPESHDLKVLEERYSPPLKKLWKLYCEKQEIS